MLYCCLLFHCSVDIWRCGQVWERVRRRWRLLCPLQHKGNQLLFSYVASFPHLLAKTTKSKPGSYSCTAHSSCSHAIEDDWLACPSLHLHSKSTSLTWASTPYLMYRQRWTMQSLVCGQGQRNLQPHCSLMRLQRNWTWVQSSSQVSRNWSCNYA